MQLPATEWVEALAVFNKDSHRLSALVADLWGKDLDLPFLRKIYWLLHANKFWEPAYQLSGLLGMAIHQDDFEYYPSEYRPNVDALWDEYRARVQLETFLVLQWAAYGDQQKSRVDLVQDRDGILKVYKEDIDYTRRPIKYPREVEILSHLRGTPGVPRYYGAVDCARVQGHWLRFIRMEHIYGRAITWATKNALLPGTARQIIRDIARILHAILQKGVLYLDIKPENILWTSEGPVLIDFGMTSKVTSPTDQVDVVLSDPRYAAPEVILYRKASQASLVYQLGILYYQLLFGQHPAARLQEASKVAASGDLSEVFEENIQAYTIPNAVTEYKVPASVQAHPCMQWCEQLLAWDPSERPTLADIALWDAPEDRALCIPQPDPASLYMLPERRKKNVVLFPARMGIPHKGHIEYINRILCCGYKALISLQWSYILTECDPLPKWVVAKLVANALQLQGWVEGTHFEIIFAPFYETDQQHKMHFLMLPEFEQGRIAAVASSNPGVHELLAFMKCPILEQKSFFAHENEDYPVRSWGEILRRAVRERDYATFQQYAVAGHEDILTFEETQAMYHQQDIPFVPGTVHAALYSMAGALIMKPRKVHRYRGPEWSLMQRMKEPGRIRYRDMTFDGTDVHIAFELLESA